MAKNKSVSQEELSALMKSVETQAPKPQTTPKQFVKEEKPAPPAPQERKPEDINVSKAFGVRRNPETKKYDIVEIHYNMSTNEAKIIDILRSETSGVVAQTRVNEAIARVMNGLKLDSMRRKI